MPVKSCQINGKKGHKWGDSGKCYTGPDSHRKATLQGEAIHASENQVKERTTLLGYLIREQSDMPAKTKSNNLQTQLNNMQHNLEMMVQQLDYFVNSNPSVVNNFANAHGHTGPIEKVFSNLQATISAIGDALNITDDHSL